MPSFATLAVCRGAEKSRVMRSSLVDQSTEMILTRSTLELPPSLGAAVAPSSGVRPPPTAVVPMTPPAAATGAARAAAWTDVEWLQTSVYHQRLREAAYRRDVSALWVAAIKQQQQHQQQRAGNYRFT